jgi:hypothetical protein
MQRMLASKTVEIGVVTFGSESAQTDNYLNKTIGGYEGVNEVVEMGRPSAATLSSIVQIADQKPSALSGDLIDGFVVGQDILNRKNKGKAFNRLMLIFTDGESKVEGIEDIETILENMKKIPNFGLHIFLLGSVTPSSTIVKRENAKLFKSIAEDANGKLNEIDSISDCFNALSSGLGLGTRPRVTKLNLEIHPNTIIPCAAWSRISETKLPSLKKTAAANKNAANREEVLHFPFIEPTDSIATGGRQRRGGPKRRSEERHHLSQP